MPSYNPGLSPHPRTRLSRQAAQRHAAQLGSSDISSILRIGQIAASATQPDVAAAEILEVFHEIVPYAAASISRWNVITDQHETLANANYPRHVVTHLDNWFVHNDEVFTLMRTMDPRPLRWRDMPFEYRRLHSAREVFMPVGFDEGVTTCLYTPDGRYTGSLHVSTDTRTHPSDAAMHAFPILQSTLAGLTDSLRMPCWLAGAQGSANFGGIVTADGELVALPTHSLGAHLFPGSPLTDTIVETLRAGSPSAGFWWRHSDGSWHRVLLQSIEEAALVNITAANLPARLTARELDVLTLIVEGESNIEIASALVLSTKTVAKHVEHLLHKLGCPTRAAAAARATGEGIIRRPRPGRPPVAIV